MNKTRKKIVDTFLKGLKESHEDAKHFRSYASVPFFYVQSLREQAEAKRMVEEGLALWLDSDCSLLGVSGEGRKVFFTADAMRELFS